VRSAPRQSKQADLRANQMDALLRAVLSSPGATDPTVRRAIFDGDSPDGPLGEYVAKIRDQSYRITDEDVKRLLESGLSQDAVFELTIAAALGAAAERMDAGMQAMQAMQAMREER
jgi:hypothetical protein